MTDTIDIPHRHPSPPFHIGLRDLPPTCIYSYLPYSDGPIQVLPHVWIGAENNARDWQAIRARNISATLNVAREVPSPFLETPQSLPVSFTECPTYYPPHFPSGRPAMHYLKLNWTHDQRDLVTQGFPSAMAFVDTALEHNQNLLIHCSSGVFRAAALVIAIVMRAAATQSPNVPVHIWRLKGMYAAYAYVKDKSKHVDLDIPLVQQLLDYECELWGGPVMFPTTRIASTQNGERRVSVSHRDTIAEDEADSNAVRQRTSALHPPEPQLTKGLDDVSPLGASFTPPPDLTPHISRVNDQYVAGGGFGDVYRCWFKEGSPKEVAVKSFRFKFAMEEDTSGRLNKMVRRELGIWRRLNHRNIVPFLGIAYGFGMHGSISLVSLWMPNESLHHFLVKHDVNLAVGHRLQLLLDVANGLHYLHSFPIVHGDLNCNNVLLDVDYTARLVDFGYASLVGEIPEGLSYLQRSTGRPGALRWIAPEQVDPEETVTRTPKSDVYSFGCVALQVLSGKQPWSEVREDSAVVLRLAKGQRPGRPTSRPIEDLHWGLIQRCWSPMVARPTAEAIVSAVELFLGCCPASPPLYEARLSWPDEASTWKHVKGNKHSSSRRARV